MKMAVVVLLALGAAWLCQAADIPIPPFASGEKIVVLRIAVGPDEPLASPVVRADGKTDWILSAPVVALNEQGEPVAYRTRIDGLIQRVRATHAKCVVAGAALGIDYATATGAPRMQCVALALVTEIGARLINDEATRSAWIAQVNAQVVAAMTPQ